MRSTTDTAPLNSPPRKETGAHDLLFSNDQLIGVQSRLYSPGYAGPARWVLFDPVARRAFSALGKDVVPDAIELLALAAGGVPRQELVRGCPGTTDDQVDGLIAARLLGVRTADRRCRTTVDTFHSANVDYPFFDYGSDNVVAVESDLLDRYAALWNSPPAIADREGPRYALPRANVGFPAREPAGFPTPDGVAVVFRTLLGAVGEIRTRHATCVRRTTPSGGARHPTELVWVCQRAVGEIPAGAFTYDVRGHCLVRESPDVDESYRHSLGDHEFGFVIRSRVARAMWRYRDLRALRPVIIDAGHVAEMLALLLSKAGVTAKVVSPQVVTSRREWLHEPELALVLPTEGSSSVKPARYDGWSPEQLADEQADRSRSSNAPTFSTNPALVLRFDDVLAAEVTWPSKERLDIDVTDFLVLNHCLPSTRGDRGGTLAAIREAVPEADEERIHVLASAGALLPAEEAASLYSDLQLWVRHEWYLSSLALLEALADGQTRPASSRLRANPDYVDDPGVLARRRTSRTFHSQAIRRDIVETLVRRAIGSGAAGLTITIAAHNVDDLDPGLYRCDADGLRRIGDPVDRDEVASATAGQSAAAAGAVTLWLSLLTDTSAPAGYVRDLLDLGRLGQRLCEVATDLDLGVFLTPAAYDRRTCELLGLQEVERLLTYVFAFGAPPEKAST